MKRHIHDDFRELKKEYLNIPGILKKEFGSVTDKLKHIDQQIAQARSAIMSLKRAVEILVKNDIEVNDCEAAIILDFLYHIAQNHNNHKANKKIVTLTRNRTY